VAEAKPLSCDLVYALFRKELDFHFDEGLVLPGVRNRGIPVKSRGRFLAAT
jgi:hypothetical protein